MPGGEDSYDLIRTKDERSNSKSDTFSINPKRLGTTENQVREIALQTLTGDLAAGAELTSLTGAGLAITNGTLRSTIEEGTIDTVKNDGAIVSTEVPEIDFTDKFNVTDVLGTIAVIDLDHPYTDLSVLFGSPTTAGATLEVSDITDGDRTVYDSSSDTLGDGTTDIDADAGTFTSATVSTSPSSSDDVATKSYVDTTAQGLDWQDSVIDEQNDPPSSPSTGGRYLTDDNPTGDWSGEPNEIAEWDGSQWVFSDPNEGWAVFVEDVDLLKVYDGAQSDWIPFGSAIDHGSLSGLAGDDHKQYLLVDGTRPMSGALDMGGSGITNAGSINGNGVVTEGDGTDREIFVIANGASDPAAAGPEDIIFEEES